MAEQIISDVLVKLGDLLIKECLFLRGVGDKVELVKTQLGQMRSFLKDAEEKKIKGDNRTQQWVRDVRDVAFEIENAIDKYIVEIHNVTGKHVSLWKRCILRPTRWRSVHKLGNKISTIQAQTKMISESRDLFGIQNLGEGIVEERPQRKLVVPDIDNEEIFGFEVERKKIIDALVDCANTQTRRVVSIVGPGGLGKTTLAKKIYNNTEVKQYFNLRVWLTISQHFKPIYVLKELYEEVTGDKKDKMEKEHVYLSKLNNYLRERTYLIVLDDVWSDEVFEWLKDGLPDDGNKREKESLELLLKNALRIPDTLGNCSDELRDVARKLASRCGGLPLAIVVLGRLLYKKPHAHWSQVEKNLDWYRDDYLFKAVPLLRMWIAEGFMDHNKKGMLEDEAEHCLEELAQRSLVQVVDRDYNGSIEYFRVHDLLRDLAIHESEENDFLLICNKENTQTDFKKARRVVIHNNHKVESQNQNLENIATPNVRSFLNFDRKVPVGIRYPLLRVLELEGSENLTKLPEELKSMIHLRYLGLKFTRLEQLPETIGCLQNLQTINIDGTFLKKIPSSLWGIQALRHVTVRKWWPGPPPSANLVNLQTLQGITVPESWRDGLPHLPSLRSLYLFYFDKEENRSIVMPDWKIVLTLLGTLHNLVSLIIQGNRIPTEIADFKTSPSYQHLQKLDLCGPVGSEPPYSTRFFLDTVELPRNLIILNLGYIWFDKDPMPKLEKLPCLKWLMLSEIENVEEMVCSAGGFPKLQDLGIWFVHDLKQWKVEKEAMPLLKTLRIEGCNKLSALPDLNHVKTLQELRLIGMSDVSESKVKDRTGEEWQKIQHIPTIKYSYF
ncbi:hypothetical protein LUZ60_002287 [Juncus effusus]|nr:hypothetical protein LUZ60_002287 [Juncus effusus]